MLRPAFILVLILLVPACSMLTPADQRVRAEQMENAVLPMAETAVAAGQLETAQRLYGRLLEVNPDSAPARMGLGDIALERQQSSAAANWYLAALEHAEDPQQRHAALLAHGRAALSAGQLEAASESFTRLTDPEESAPPASVAWGHNGIGLTRLLEGDLRGAIAAMERAALLDPEEARFQANLNRALTMLDRAPPPAEDPVEDQPDDPQPEPEESLALADEEMETDSELAAPDGDSSDPEPEPEPAHELDEPMGADQAAIADSSNSHFVGARASCPRNEPEISIEGGTPSLRGASLDATKGQNESCRADSGNTATPDEDADPPGRWESIHDLLVDLVQNGYEFEDGSMLAELANGSGSLPTALILEDRGSFLQAGAYTERYVAETLAEELHDLTQRPVRVVETAGEDGMALHRVRIGPLDSGDPLVEPHTVSPAAP